MPRPLTAVAINNAKPDPSRRREIADGAAPGLRLVVQPSGFKSWAFRYERPGGNAVKLGLGPAAGPGAIPLADARQRVGEMRRDIATGRDPAEVKKAEQGAALARMEAEKAAAVAAAMRDEERVDALIERYCSRHVDTLKSSKEVRRLFAKEVKPRWGSRLVSEITKRDVAKLLDDIADRGAGTTANRVLANVRAWFGWCIDRGLIDKSPAERLRAPKKEVARERVLSDVEVTCLARALDRLAWPWRDFFTVVLLTAQRREEVAGMRWAELDLTSSKPTWLLPSARTKNGREHAVPLSSPVVEALRAMPRIEGSPFVFTTTGDTSVSGFSRAKASLDEAIRKLNLEAETDAESAIETEVKIEAVEPWRLHDLRRTAASSMARLGVSVAIVEKVLNHVSGTFAGIVGVYQRHDFATEKRKALTLWAEHVADLKGKP